MGQLCFLAFRSASSGPKQPVVEDQQTDKLPGFWRQLVQVGAEKNHLHDDKANCYEHPFQKQQTL
jgi:hypothetical protein